MTYIMVIQRVRIVNINSFLELKSIKLKVIIIKLLTIIDKSDNVLVESRRDEL